MLRDQVIGETGGYARRWWAFTVLVLTIVIVVIDHTILNVALPTIQRELGSSVSELQWIVDAYILAFATLLLTMGTLSDRIGRATMLRAGLTVFGMASLAALFAQSAWQLILARIFMGAGAAMIMPATLAIITNIFPDEERGKAIAIWGAMNGVGVAAGPLLGGVLIQQFNWSAVFFINVPIVIVALIAGQFLVPNSYDPSPRRIDIPGTILSALALAALVFSLIKGSDWGWANPIIICSLAASVIFAILFLLRERNTASPMLDLRLFRNPRLAAGSICIGFMTIAMFGVLFGFTMYMQFIKNYTAMETGIRFLPMAFGYAFGSMSSNHFARLWGTKTVVTAGFLGMSVIAIPVAFWRVETPYWEIGALLFALSFFMGNIMTPSLNALLGAVPKARAGIGSAIGNVSFQLGGALGVAALGSVLSSVYRMHMSNATDSLATIPGQITSAVIESIGAVARIYALLPESSRANVISLASQSFMSGWQFLLLCVAVLGLTGAIIALKVMPQRDIPQEEL